MSVSFGSHFLRRGNWEREKNFFFSTYHRNDLLLFLLLLLLLFLRLNQTEDLKWKGEAEMGNKTVYVGDENYVDKKRYSKFILKKFDTQRCTQNNNQWSRHDLNPIFFLNLPNNLLLLLFLLELRCGLRNGIEFKIGGGGEKVPIYPSLFFSSDRWSEHWNGWRNRGHVVVQGAQDEIIFVLFFQ